MKYFILLLTILTYSLNLPAQNIGMFVMSSDTTVVPDTSTFETNNTALNNVLDNYTVTGFRRGMPNATTADAFNTFKLNISDTTRYIELHNDLDSLNLFQDLYIVKIGAWANCNPVSYDDPLSNASYYIDAMNIACAWDITEGDPNITVAVVDQYFDHGHDDLENKFVEIKGDCDPSKSVCGHGFASAGAIAAIVNNNKCVAGSGNKTTVAGYCTLGNCWSGYAGRQIRNAYNDGYKLINASNFNVGNPRAYVEEMVANGVVVTLSGGGSYHSAVADIDGVINVGMVNSSFNYVPYFTHDYGIDIYAAAVNVPRLQAQNTCAEGAGLTSWGAPTVMGIVALMKDVNPCLTPADIENIIKDTHQGLPYNASQYPEVVNGIIDAYAAVQAAQSFNGIDKVVTGVETIESEVISGDLIVETGAELTVTGRLKFGSNSRVLIKRGARMILDGGELTLNEACGSTYWKGVFVEGNSVDPANDPDDVGKTFVAQPSSPYSQLQADQCGVLVMINNSTISKAKNGVLLYNYYHPWPSFNDYYGGLIYAENSNFVDNSRAIAFMKYGYGTRVDKSKIIGCDFSSVKEGITNWASNGVLIDGCTFDVGLREAIIAYDASIDVVNGCTFNGAPSEARAISLIQTHPNVNASQIGDLANNANQFNDCHYGVYGESTLNSGELNIVNNIFSNNYYGVFMEGVSRYKVQKNDFIFNTIGQCVYDNGEYFHYISKGNYYYECKIGIYSINSNRGYKFLDNCFDGNPSRISDLKRDLAISGLPDQTAEINEYQRNSFFVSAGNLFTEALYNLPPQNTAISFYDNRGLSFNEFKYYVYKNCTIPADCLKHPGGYSNKYAVVSSSMFDTELDCGANANEELYDSGYCNIPETITINNLKDSINSMENYISQVENELADTSHPVDSSLLMYELDEYTDCLHKLKCMLIVEYVDASSFTAMVNYFSNSNEDNFGIKTLVYGALVDNIKYTMAENYLQSITTFESVQQDFVGIQEINLERLIEGDTFTVTEAELSYIYNTGNQSGPLNGFARGLYHILTGEYIELPIPSSSDSTVYLREYEDSGTSEKKKSNAIAFPNPIRDELNINFESFDQPDRIEILNLNGNYVYSGKSLINGEIHSISTSQWYSGVYILILYDNNENILHTERILKF